MKIDDILPLFDHVRSMSGDRWIARCPAHEDSRPSLSMRQAGDRILIYCHAGCSLRAISDAIGLRESDWFEDNEKPEQSQGRANKVLLFSSRLNQQRAYRAELHEVGNELRRRDMERLAISKSVADGKRTEDEAMELLAPLYQGYSELEFRFSELLKWA